MENKKFYTIKELCLSNFFPFTSRTSIVRLVEKGELEMVNFSERKRYITKNSVDQYLKNKHNEY